MAGPHPFHPLPEPVSPAEAMAALYAAFADWPKPRGPFCDRCFDPAAEARILQATPLEALPPQDFRAIFDEHPACSVGYVGLFHFMPRALETLFFDLDIHPDLAALAVEGGLYGLREPRRAALADAAAETMRTFFAGKTPRPFTAEPGSSTMTMPYFQAKAGVRLVRLMLVLQVDPGEIFRALTDIGGEIVWNTFAAALDEGTWAGGAGAGAGGLDITATIDRVAWIDFARAVDPATFSKGRALLDAGGARSLRPQHAAARYRERTAASAGQSRRKLSGRLGAALELARARAV